MKHTDPRDFAPHSDDIHTVSPEEYVQLLHPQGVIGNPAVLIKNSEKPSQQFTRCPDGIVACLHALLDRTSFISLNRFKGTRCNSGLVSLNSLYVDLDYHNDPGWRAEGEEDVQAAVAGHLLMRGVSEPSFYLRTGRGLAAIWLIHSMPPAALSRWQAAIRALMDLLAHFGSDRSCNDPARVFRIPGTRNEKSGRVVQVSGGNCQRQDFDVLADQIFAAVGRPTRSELAERRKQRQDREPGSQTMPRGLTQAERFEQILKDLEAYRIYHGGVIPVGYRNTWLHFYATCLTHQSDTQGIEGHIQRAADMATPGLCQNETNAIIKQALAKSKLQACDNARESERYCYRGSTVAERLDVSADMARQLSMRQVMPAEERHRRKAERERARRAVQGSTSRDQYLLENSASRNKPWLNYGLGRSQYYARKKAGTLPELPVAPDRTGPCPLQGNHSGHREFCGPPTEAQHSETPVNRPIGNTSNTLAADRKAATDQTTAHGREPKQRKRQVAHLRLRSPDVAQPKVGTSPNTVEDAALFNFDEGCLMTLQTEIALPSENWKSRLKVGDVAAFRFPHETMGEDDPKVRPSLVIDVEEMAGERFAVLAYGTTNPCPRKQAYCVDVRSEEEREQASLRAPTRFNAARRVSVSVNNSGFDRNSDGTPVLGELADAALDRLHRVRARIHAERDIRRSRRFGSRGSGRKIRAVTVETRRKGRPDTREVRYV